MDIKKLLNEEIEKAKKNKEEQETEEARKEREAKQLFLPVSKAIKQLSEELSSHDDIKFYISDHHIDINLGKNIKLEAHRYSRSSSFKVDQTNTYEFPEYEVIERSHDFNTSDEVVSYLVKECAEYVATKKN